ncbi:hypothetical protein JCGZ_05215 [Jatropha curcas]|uniref:Uncharacterized protein n=1 Tax=Jatropha curcas TaxID=180498 RepID=A0A067KZT0_JATCU|nr:hypothetical protein JCGZ_05215 [Jatropha curcas]
MDNFNKILDEQSSQVASGAGITIDQTQIYLEAAGGKKKQKVYRNDKHASVYYNNFTTAPPSATSSATQDPTLTEQQMGTRQGPHGPPHTDTISAEDADIKPLSDQSPNHFDGAIDAN